MSNRVDCVRTAVDGARRTMHEKVEEPTERVDCVQLAQWSSAVRVSSAPIREEGGMCSRCVRGSSETTSTNDVGIKQFKIDNEMNRLHAVFSQLCRSCLPGCSLPVCQSASLPGLPVCEFAKAPQGVCYWVRSLCPQRWCGRFCCCTAELADPYQLHGL